MHRHVAIGLCDQELRAAPHRAMLLDDDFDVAAEEDEKANQAIEREAGQLAATQCGNLRLLDVENVCSLRLREMAALDNLREILEISRSCPYSLSIVNIGSLRSVSRSRQESQ